MGASHCVFNGENSVLQSFNSLLEEIRIKPGSWNDFEEYLVISSVRVANAGAMEAPTVSELALVGWRWFEREQHAEIAKVSFAKSGKT